MRASTGYRLRLHITASFSPVSDASTLDQRCALERGGDGQLHSWRLLLLVLVLQVGTVPTEVVGRPALAALRTTILPNSLLDIAEPASAGQHRQLADSGQ